MPSGFRWVISPERELIPNIRDYGVKALVAVQAVATYWGQGVQDEARREAVWEDRTGNARSGLFFAVDGLGMSPIVGEVTPEAQRQMDDVTVESGSANVLIITLGHTVFYGKFLETSNGERYAIVMSTIEKNLPQLERDLREVFGN